MNQNDVVDATASLTRDQWLEKATTLSEALPYMRRYHGATFVVKYGGHAMGDAALAEKFARDIVLMKHVGINPVVVHGGGPQIGRMLDRLKIQSEFIDGLRKTDRDTVDVVEMVLAGSINKSIVSAIQAVGGQAIGLSGKDGGLIKARKMRRTRRDPESNIEKILDLGFVGEPVEIDPGLLEVFEDTDYIPVIAPIGMGLNGETLNINADTAAGAIAGALQASRLFLLTDVAGVLDGEGTLIPELSAKQARALIADGTISGGMIPKIETCLNAVETGVDASVILDGRVPHALLLEVFTAGGVGTMIGDAGDSHINGMPEHRDE
jgi:acetylglutamate kinase